MVSKCTHPAETKKGGPENGTVSALAALEMLSRALTTIILNPRAGAPRPSGRSAVDLVGLFRTAGQEAQLVAVNDGADPTEAARAATTHSGVVVACGGDGTVSGVAAALCDSSATLGILPTG